MLNIEELQKLVQTPAFLIEMEGVLQKAMGGYRYASGVEFDEGSWLVIGLPHTTPLCPRKGETITILYEDTEVWMMQSFGQYQTEVIPCLEAALRAAAAEKQFFGGRGPEKFVFDEYTYRNEIDRTYRTGFQRSNFFKGYEEVRKTGGEIKGWQFYQGGMMIPAPD